MEGVELGFGYFTAMINRSAKCQTSQVLVSKNVTAVFIDANAL